MNYCHCKNCRERGRYKPLGCGLGVAKVYCAGIAVIASLVAVLGLVGYASAAEVLETSNTTANSNNAASSTIYIGTNDRETIYDEPNDTLSRVTIKVHNGTGYACNNISGTAYAQDDEIMSDSIFPLVDIPNGADAELNYNWYSNPDIRLGDLTKIRFGVSSCWSGLTFIYNSADVWGTDSGTNLNNNSSYDPWIKIYGLEGDPRENPPALLYPADNGNYNPLGVPYLIVSQEVNNSDYAGENPTFRLYVEVSDGQGGWDAYQTYTGFWAQYSYIYGLIDGYGNYAFGDNPALIIGDNFPENDYRARATAEYEGFAETNPSPWNYFTTSAIPIAGFDVSDLNDGAWGADTAPPVVTCSVSNIPECILKIFRWLVIPSDGAFISLGSALGEIKNRWPFSWVSTFYGGFIGALNATPEDLGEPDGGNWFKAQPPNAAWIAEAIKGYWGNWAEPLAKAVIWLVVALAIGRSGLTLLGVPVDSEDT